MTYLRESFLYGLWIALLEAYESSAVHRALAALGRLVLPPGWAAAPFCACFSGRERWPGPGRAAVFADC